MTPTQRRTLHAIGRYTAERGMPPTERWIARALGVTQTAVSDQLRRLKQAGCVRAEPRKARTLRVVAFGGRVPVHYGIERGRT